jgi:hypothetical protein
MTDAQLLWKKSQKIRSDTPPDFKASGIEMSFVPGTRETLSLVLAYQYFTHGQGDPMFYKRLSYRKFIFINFAEKLL